MKLNDKNVSEKSMKSTISIVLYVAAAVVALVGIALLINNINLFKNTVNQYVAQGYAAADVTKQLIPSQLIPGIFEPIGIYGGIAFALLGIGIANKKVSKCLIQLNNTDVCCNTVEESISEENTVNEEETETAEQTEAPENSETPEHTEITE